MSAADPWEHFTEQDRVRLQGMPLETLAFTLLDEATPRASAKQLSDALEIPPREGKRFHAAWKAARASGRTQEDEHAALENEDVRDKFEREFTKAFITIHPHSTSHETDARRTRAPETSCTCSPRSRRRAWAEPGSDSPRPRTGPG